MAFGCGEESDAGCSGASETKNPNEKAGDVRFWECPPPKKKNKNNTRKHTQVSRCYIYNLFWVSLTKIDEIIFDTDFPKNIPVVFVPWDTFHALGAFATGSGLLPGVNSNTFRGGNPWSSEPGRRRPSWDLGMIFFLVKPIHMSSIKMVKWKTRWIGMTWCLLYWPNFMEIMSIRVVWCFSPVLTQGSAPLKAQDM